MGAERETLPEVKALIMVVSRPAGVRDAVEQIGPEFIGLIVSQQVLEEVVLVCAELREREAAQFSYRLVGSPMDIGDTFREFESLLFELEGLGYERDSAFLDPTGGTTPMRIGSALAAMTRGVKMLHQQAPQQRVEGQWQVEKGAKTTIVQMHNPLEATGLLREGTGGGPVQPAGLRRRGPHLRGRGGEGQRGGPRPLLRGAPAPGRRLRRLGRGGLRRRFREAEGGAGGIGRGLRRSGAGREGRGAWMAEDHGPPPLPGPDAGKEASLSRTSWTCWRTPAAASSDQRPLRRRRRPALPHPGDVAPVAAPGALLYLHRRAGLVKGGRGRPANASWRRRVWRSCREVLDAHAGAAAFWTAS